MKLLVASAIFTSAAAEMWYRMEDAGKHLKVKSCRDIPEGTYNDPVGTCEEHGYKHMCLSCMYLMEFFVQDAATCTQASTECYFKKPDEKCVGSSLCPYKPPVVVSTAASPPNKDMLFKGFMEKYSREYETDFEKGRRYQIFSENVDMIYASNAQNKSYTLGVTATADLTVAEFRTQYMTGYVPSPTAEKKNRDVFAVPEGFAEPDDIDWVKKGGVTSVKNQGTCGSCWTFSTVGALEGAMFVAGRSIQDLSMQHILACDEGGHGCGGGSMDQAFGWVAENGVPSLADEPYICKDGSSTACKGMTCSACTKQTGETCIFNTKCAKVPGSKCNTKSGLIHKCECPADQCFTGSTTEQGKCGAPEKPVAMVIAVGDVTSHTDVHPTEGALEAAVAQQPVSVAIEADQAVFQHYTGGVLTNDACGSQLDHGVLAVGYGVDKGVQYWKVKNSWGTTFGEDGFIRIEKGSASDGGECGIRKMASFPTIKKSTTSEVIV